MTHTVVLASGNEGKLRELQHALAPLSLSLQTQRSLGVEDAVEDGLTFVENALIKARHAAACTGLPALADDSGLVVPALGGAPGIYSSRYSGQGDAGNNSKLLDAMATLSGTERDAYFVCVLVYLRASDDPCPIIAEGRWHGRIATQREGEGGFGYDPVFALPELNCTAAALSPEQKTALSHRGKAVAALRDRFEH